VLAIIFRNVHNQLPGDTASHLSSKDTECSWPHSGWNWWFWGADNAEGNEAKVVKEIFEINMRIGMLIAKWMLKKLVLFLHFILHNCMRKSVNLD